MAEYGLQLRQDKREELAYRIGSVLENIGDFGNLPPALKAQLVKKLTGVLAKEKDPKKKAEIEAKIKKYS